MPSYRTVPNYRNNKHFERTFTTLRKCGYTDPPWHFAYKRAVALDEGNWDNLEHIPTLPTHVFAVWWDRHADHDLLPGRLERQFLVYKRRKQQELVEEVDRRAICSTKAQIPSETQFNLHETLSYPRFRLTRNLIEFVESK